VHHACGKEEVNEAEDRICGDLGPFPKPIHAADTEMPVDEADEVPVLIVDTVAVGRVDIPVLAALLALLIVPLTLARIFTRGENDVCIRHRLSPPSGM
jgi:hypothetical protein